MVVDEGTVRRPGPPGGSRADPPGFSLDTQTYVSVITMSSLTVTSTINLGTGTTGPKIVAITPDGTTAYIVNNTSGTLVPFTVATRALGTAISLQGTTACVEPRGLGLTPNGATLYVTCQNSAGTTTTTAGANNPYYVAITPDQAPVASFTAPAVTLGSPTSFDARASGVDFGTIASYAWDFGDGTTLTTATPTTSHTYANPGSYTATVTATSSAGTSTTDVFTGQTMSRNGGPTAVTTRTVTVNDTLGWTAAPGNIDVALTLNGQSQATTATLPLKVAGGISTLGWSISATSTRFTSGPHTLPSTAVTVQTTPTRSCDSTCTLATTSVSYPYTLPAGTTAPAATKIYNAAANTGMGSQTVTPTFTLTIPATTRAGTYTSTWTYTLSSGP